MFYRHIWVKHKEWAIKSASGEKHFLSKTAKANCYNYHALWFGVSFTSKLTRWIQSSWEMLFQKVGYIPLYLTWYKNMKKAIKFLCMKCLLNVLNVRTLDKTKEQIKVTVFQKKFTYKTTGFITTVLQLPERYPLMLLSRLLNFCRYFNLEGWGTAHSEVPVLGEFPEREAVEEVEL